jgi:nucleotide-binding universal stress UspA family protein
MLKAAEADGADLIVLGARAMSRLEEVTIGRASNKIVHAAKVPVLLVR